VPEQRPTSHETVIITPHRPCIVTDHQEQLRAILEHPDYDQSMLREWFQQRYGDWWLQAWQRYLETGDISW
jgi:hypothetical protein